MNQNLDHLKSVGAFLLGLGVLLVGIAMLLGVIRWLCGWPAMCFSSAPPCSTVCSARTRTPANRPPATALNQQIEGKNAALGKMGLIAWYVFDNGVARDCSGYGNDGILHGVVSAPDRRGRATGAMYFNGTNAWIEVKSSALYDNLDEISLALWVRPRDEGRGDVDENLISKQPSGQLSPIHSPVSSNHGGLFDLDLHMADGCGQVIFCSQVLPNMTTEGHTARMPPLPANQWQHVAVTVSRAENRVRFYVNGVKADDIVYTEQTRFGHILSQPNDEPIRIGKRKDADFGHHRYFCGWMADVRIYNRVLRDEEVASLVGGP